MWHLKDELSEKADAQTSQENSYSPVCIRMCFFKEELCENAAPQTSQENGFSPV